MRFLRPSGAALALASALACVSPPTAACTPAPGYRVPTNLELSGEAEAIVLARVTAGELDEGGDPFESTVTIHPLEALKGAVPEREIALKGMMLSRDAGPELGMLSDPHEFERAHPVSYVGGCIRYVFPLGTTALFFLERQGVEWVPAGGPFSRWAEDVTGPQAPWVQLVRLYLEALARPEPERAAWLETRREALRARSDDRVAQLMAADIARQLDAAPTGDTVARLDEAGSAAAESALEAEIRRLRQAAIEAGN